MVNRPAGCAMVVSIEVGCVAGHALTSASNSRGFENPICRYVMTGGAAISRMNLSCADKRGDGGVVATNAIGG